MRAQTFLSMVEPYPKKQDTPDAECREETRGVRPPRDAREDAAESRSEMGEWPRASMAGSFIAPS